MALKSIEEEWQGFANMAFGDRPVSDTQRAEMKKAFFAGAWSMITAMEEIGQPHISEDEGVQFFEARRAECTDFKNQILREYSEEN